MRVKSEFYRLVENDVKMLDALAARIESRRAKIVIDDFRKAFLDTEEGEK